MRNYTLNIRLAAVMVAPLLLACGSNGTGSSGYVTVPNCMGAANQVLTTDSTGQLVCQALPAGAVSLPACQANVEALTADGTNLSCAPLNNVDSTTQGFLTTLSMIESQIQMDQATITKIGAGPAAQAIYVGPSKQATTGRIMYGTATPGVAAAAAQCANDYGAGAHMCTVYEMYYSVALLKNVAATTDIAASWVYMQSWKTPGSVAAYPAATPSVPSPYQGLSDNCGGYTQATASGGSGSNVWTGTAFNYTAGYLGVMTYNPRFVANTSCAMSLPIACCQ
jgi:hypothetical protein